MQKIKLSILLCALGFAFYGCKDDTGLEESQKQQFIKYYGVAAEGNDMVQTNDGGFLMIGTTDKGVSKDIYIVKTDAFGNRQWTQTYDAFDFGLDDIANAVVLRPDGGFGVVGTIIEPYRDLQDTTIEKTIQRSYILSLNYLGNMQFEKIFGDLSLDRIFDERGNGIILSSSGEYIMACHQTHKNDLTDKGIGRKISVYDGEILGNFEAQKLDGNGALIDFAFTDVIEYPAGSDGFIYLGSTKDISNNVEGVSGVLIGLLEFGNKIDPPNTTANEGVFGSINTDIGISMVLNSDGKLICVGVTGNPGDTPEENDFKGIMYEANPANVADPPSEINPDVHYTGKGGNTEFHDIIVIDEGYIIAGLTVDGGKKEQMYLVKADKSGNILWKRTYGSLGFDIAKTVCQTSDGGYAIFGTSTDNRGNTVMCLIKTDGAGNIN